MIGYGLSTRVISSSHGRASISSDLPEEVFSEEEERVLAEARRILDGYVPRAVQAAAVSAHRAVQDEAWRALVNELED